MESSATSILISVLPFVLLLALWFFLLQQMRKGGRLNRSSLIDPMQQMLVQTIVPEMRALRESVDRLGAEIKALGERGGQ
jgi:hypothetical protein